MSRPKESADRASRRFFAKLSRVVWDGMGRFRRVEILLLTPR
jgi:hypothetical protein